LCKNDHPPSETSGAHTHRDGRSGAPTPAEVLHALPYGVVGIGADGRVGASNAAADAMVPALATGRPRCHELFECRAPGGPCEEACEPLRQAGLGKAMPEIRVDAVPGASPGALWLTSAPVGDDGGALLHLRPASRWDRRRRADGQRRGGADLSVFALGPTRLESTDDTLVFDWLEQKPGELFKFLVCERSRVVMADEIAEAVWPDSGPRGISNVRYAIFRLRNKLEPDRRAGVPSSYIVARGEGYTLDPERVWTDADEFERGLVEARTALRATDTDAATGALERALARYRGDFLADEPYAFWATDERYRLLALATSGLRLLADLARRRGDGDNAIEQLTRLVAIDPFDEEMHRELIVALQARGSSEEAGRVYDGYAARLLREFHDKPGFDLDSPAG
jgi:DNA-binding SARP family transcriptional activator